MNVKCLWRDLGPLNALKVLFPSKWKKYLMKWLKIFKSRVKDVFIYSDTWHGDIFVKIFLMPHGWNELDDMMADLDFDAWIPHASVLQNNSNEILSTIAKFENMRNADELCIWLDMKDI